MKVGARASDLRLRVSAGSGEQIHFGRPRCPVLGGEQLSPPSGWRLSYLRGVQNRRTP